MNKEYIFTLKYKLPTHETNMDELVDRLYAAHCDDALIGVGIAGRIALEFAREAHSAEVAIKSAHQDVLKTIPEAQFIEALPDYVGITDIAEIVNVSRQHIRQLYQSNLDSFPTPVHEGKSSIWHLIDIVEWFVVKQKNEIEPAIYEVAKETEKLNRVRTTGKNLNIKTALVEYCYSFDVVAEYFSSAEFLFASGKQKYSQLAEAA